MSDIPVYQFPTNQTVPSMAGLWQAAQAGYETGLKVPTIAGAVATGLTDAVKLQSDLAYKDAQIQNLQADAAFKQAEGAYYLQGTKTQKDQAQINLANARAGLIDSKVGAQQDLQGLYQQISTADPITLKSMLDPNTPAGQKFASTVFANAKNGADGLLASVANRIGNDPESTVALQNMKQQLQNYNWNSSKKSLQDTLVSSQITGGQKAQNALMEDGILQTWFPNASDPSQYFSGKMVPSGVYKFGTDGRPDKSISPNYSTADYTKYDLIDSQGNLIQKEVPKKLADQYGVASIGFTAQNRLNYDSIYGPGAYDAQQQRNAQVQLNQGGAIQNVPPPQGQPQGAPAQPQNTDQNVVAQTQSGTSAQSFINQGATQKQNLINSARNTWATKFSQGPLSPATPTQAPAPQAQTIPKPLYKPTSFEALSEATQMPVDVNVKSNYSVPEGVYTSINSNPLLANSNAAIKGLSAIESSGNENAISPTGVGGLLQVTQNIARYFGYNRDIPAQNVLAGTAYFNYLLGAGKHDPNLGAQFPGHLMLAAAAYNAGPGVINDAVKEAGTTDWNVVKQYVKQIVSPEKWDEVENYPERFIKATAQFIDPNSVADKTILSYMTFDNLLTAKQVNV